MPFERISVIGLGYIGLPTAAILASRKKQVIGLDVNKQTVDIINQGKIHIVEPELDMIVHAAVKEGYLKATTQPEPADAFLIAVPTPFQKASHEPDLNYIKAAIETIAPVLKKGNLIVLESTSPVGTTEQIAEWLAGFRRDLTFPNQNGDQSDIRIAHCPERVLPGHVIRELVENDRVIGGMTKKCSEQAIELYKTFVKGECVITNARTAEMAKLTENACRDVQIAFANELSVICDKLDINVWELIELANRHPRINILQPGPGVGGHCIAVDPWFIVSKTPDEARLIKTAREVNDRKPDWVINKVKLASADFLQANPDKTAKDITIAFFGLSFKANIDDLRESPALQITNQFAKEHPGNVIAVEPNVDKLKNEFAIDLYSYEDAVDKADIAVLLVDHDEFRQKGRPEIDHVIDTKGIW